MLEASTRARTGDSAETIKLFEKQFALSWVTILKLQKDILEV